MEIFEMQKEFDALMKRGQELIKMLKEEKVADATKTKRWKPKCGEYYSTIEWNGRVYSYNWDNDLSDCNCFILGNCFKTEQEAQKELDRRIVESELLDLCDWDNETDIVWSILYSVNDGVFDCSWSSFAHSPYCFASEESCKKAIKQLGTERLKLIFRID